MSKEKEYKISKHRRWLAVLCGVLIFVVGVLGVLQLGCLYTEKTFKYWYPNYEKKKIDALLEKESLTEEEYDLLYRQTGLTKLGIDDMRKTEEGRGKILRIQKAFFTDFKVIRTLFNPFTYMDEIDGLTTICDVKDGDILVTATTRVSWWQYGHAAIVIDGENNRLAESIGPGSVSEISHVNVFNFIANFMVLRPKVDENIKKQVANFVKTEMIGLPYSYTAGIFSKKYEENIKSSQCAHFVWYAYKKFGIDLDSNGGRLVKPQDIALSNQVELVQAFGYDLDKLWS